MSKTNFEAIAAGAQELGRFLRSLPILEAPWDTEFQKRYCSGCAAENCDACPNECFRNNPEWWLSLEADSGGGNVKRIQRQFAAVLSMAIVAIPLVAFMPWSGTGEQEGIPPSAAEETPLLSPPPILTLAPETPEPEYIPDAAEVEALCEDALRGSARDRFGYGKAACVWCVLNRVDDPRFPDTVLEVLEAPYQFAGYSADYPVLPELAALAADVLKRYHAEKSRGKKTSGASFRLNTCISQGRAEQSLHDRLERR